MKKLLFIIACILYMSNIIYAGPIREKNTIDRLWEMYENDYRPYRYGRQYYESRGPGDYIYDYRYDYYREYVPYNVRASIVYNPTGQWYFRDGWHFMFTNGAYANNCWLLQGSKWYYLDSRSNMVVGFATIDGSTYYFNPDGTMFIGSTTINGVEHNFDSSGRMVY